MVLTSGIIEEIRAIRQKMYEEEKHLGRDEFVRRERERVKEFLKENGIRLIATGDPRVWRLRGGK